jgi:hypothetical protein
MKVQELIRELQKFPPDTDVELFAGKCCHVQPIHKVYFHPGGAEPPSIVLVDETEQPCIPGRCNCNCS